MTRKIIFTRILILSLAPAVLLFLANPLLFGSAITTVNLPKQTAQGGSPIAQIIRKEGWLIPGLREARKTSSSEKIRIDGIEISRGELSLVKELPVDLDSYYNIGVGQLQINSQRCIVQDFHSYNINGRTFAYEVGLVPLFVGQGGAKSYAGAIFILRYYDADGDGRFEIRYTNPQTLFIPEWVKPRRL